MDLRTFLIQAKLKGINKQYVFYKDERGEVKNICFQDGVFLAINRDKTVRILNPILTIDVLMKIHKKELRIVGSGEYRQKIEYANYKINKGEKRAWKLS